MPRYQSDKQLSDVAREIIEQHHPGLKILKIAYLFREEASVSKGKVIAGMAIKTSDRDWALHKHDVIVEIGKDVWTEATPDFQKALMDHELSHVGIDMDENNTPKMDEMTNRIKVTIRYHDIEEFEGVLKRHGAYHKELRAFLEAWPERKKEQDKAKAAGMTGGMSNTSEEV